MNCTEEPSDADPFLELYVAGAENELVPRTCSSRRRPSEAIEIEDERWHHRTFVAQLDEHSAIQIITQTREVRAEVVFEIARWIAGNIAPLPEGMGMRGR